MNWSVQHDGYVEDKTLFDSAVAFRKSIMSGEAKAVAEDVVRQEEDAEAPF